MAHIDMSFVLEPDKALEVNNLGGSIGGLTRPDFCAADMAAKGASKNLCARQIMSYGLLLQGANNRLALVEQDGEEAADTRAEIQLQEAEIKEDLGQVARLAQALVAEADDVGFGSLSSCAALVEACCLEEDAEAVHKHLVELTEIARRIRLGHRGAA